MNDDGRGFSPCRSQAATGAPSEWMRGRGRRVRVFFACTGFGAGGTCGATGAFVFAGGTATGREAETFFGFASFADLAGFADFTDFARFAGFAGFADFTDFADFVVFVVFVVFAGFAGLAGLRAALRVTAFAAFFTRFATTFLAARPADFVRAAAFLVVRRAAAAAFFPCTFAISDPFRRRP
ncbi:MAG TPA: hypothetical protein VM779_07035 [Thermoanaerobaculia bacterium]|nr:hypothetical protein [Thermoanaerobaculia bacterium]